MEQRVVRQRWWCEIVRSSQASFEATQDQPHGRMCRAHPGESRCVYCVAVDGSRAVSATPQRAMG